MDGKFKNLPWALAKELSQVQSRPSWESQNEGIHERVNFDDTIWGFNLAGGAYYETPLRVTQVKENSRAFKAGIKVGDTLRYINDLDTSRLTVQEAHDMILQSGIEIKLKLSAPDVDEPYHYTYEDQILEELRELKRKRDEENKKKRKPFTGAKTNAEWSCAWPCTKKRDVMYKESNCFLIPSKHEEKMRLIKEKKKREEDRAAEEENKEIIKLMMQTQNAYQMMDSDEEIEPQFFELLEKNITKEESSTGELENHPNDTIQENIEELHAEDENRDSDNIVINEDNEGLLDDLIETVDEDTDPHNNGFNGLMLSDDEAEEIEENFEEIEEVEESKADFEPENLHSDQKMASADESKLNDKDETHIENDNETYLDEGIDENACYEGGDEEISKIESDLDKETIESNQKRNGFMLNSNDDTKLVDEEFSIPSDDEEMFHEELVIFDESDLNSETIVTDEDNDIKKKYQASEEVALAD